MLVLENPDRTNTTNNLQHKKYLYQVYKVSNTWRVTLNPYAAGG